MSPSRLIEMPTCWKSFQSCASRRIGLDTWPASMLKATSSPTLSWLSITSVAPIHMIAAVTSLLTSVTPPPATVATFVTASPDET